MIETKKAHAGVRRVSCVQPLGVCVSYIFMIDTIYPMACFICM